MLYCYKDFARLYKVCPHTIRKKIAAVLPLFRNFDPQKRKRLFNYEEAEIIFKILGTPQEHPKFMRLKNLT